LIFFAELIWNVLIWQIWPCLTKRISHLDAMLDALTPKTRMAWLLSRLDGLAHAEIAAKLGVSVPRVRQYLAKAARHVYLYQFGQHCTASDEA
jgi:thioredoxin-like negative regulator of GroEL